jgi:hypothetical protein
MAMATSAAAGSILFSGPQNVPPATNPDTQFGLVDQPIDLDGAPSNHILHLVAGFGTFPAAGTIFGSASLKGVGILGHPLFVQIFDTGTFAKDFSRSAKISAGAGSLKVQGKLVQGFTTGSVLGQFGAGHSGFAGFALQTTNGTKTDYGWIQLVFENGGNGLPASLIAKEWAIEEDGGSILAGQTADPSSAPEPGTMALSILASGAAGLMALRRRREQIARP